MLPLGDLVTAYPWPQRWKQEAKGPGHTGGKHLSPILVENPRGALGNTQVVGKRIFFPYTF